jgi:hypothetical protein
LRKRDNRLSPTIFLTRLPSSARTKKKAGPVTEAEGGLFSHVGAGPSPTRQEDRPAPDSAGQTEDEKTAFETNAKEIHDAFDIAALVYSRRRSTLQAFIRAGRKIIARLIGAGFAPLPDRPGRAGGKSPNQPRPH